MFCFAANKRVSSQQQQQIWHLPQRPIYRKIFLKKNKQTKPALAGSPPCPACFVKISKLSFLKHQTNILQIRKQKKNL